MKMEQGTSRTQKPDEKVKVITKPSLEEAINSTDRTDNTISPELSEPIDNDDQSYTESKLSEELEAIQLNPEVGLLPSKEFTCAIVKTERGYRIVNFSQAAIDEGLINAVKSFPYFEKLDSEKLLHLLTDERTTSLFGVKRGKLSKLIVLLPNFQTITLSMMKRKRGKNEPADDKYYRIFRSIILKHVDEINQLNANDFENVTTFEEFCETFFKKVGIISDAKLNILDALQHSKRAMKVLKEYYEFFCKKS